MVEAGDAAAAGTDAAAPPPPTAAGPGTSWDDEPTAAAAAAAAAPVEQLTPLGRLLALLPLEPRLGKLLVMGAALGCMAPTLVSRAHGVWPDSGYVATTVVLLRLMSFVVCDGLAFGNASRASKHRQEQDWVKEAYSVRVCAHVPFCCICAVLLQTIAAAFSHKSPFAAPLEKQDELERVKVALSAPAAAAAAEAAAAAAGGRGPAAAAARAGGLAAGQQSDQLLLIAAFEMWRLSGASAGPQAAAQVWPLNAYHV